MKKLLSPKNLEELRESIDDITHPGNSYRYRGFSDLQLAPQDSEGSSVVVLADNGDIVIATSSLNSKYKYSVKKTMAFIPFELKISYKLIIYKWDR